MFLHPNVYILVVLKLRYRLFSFWFAAVAAFCAAEGFTSTAKLNLAARLLPAATCGCFFTLVFVPCKVPSAHLYSTRGVCRENGQQLVFP